MKIKRNVFNKLYSEIKEPEVSILLGARQVGKTTLMEQLLNQAKRDGYKTAYFNLEQTSTLAKFTPNNDETIKMLLAHGDVIFIDEFHYLKNASKLFKEIFDAHHKLKIYASGSSSLEIHKHLKESLAGRFTKTKIYPLSLNEFKKTKKTLQEYLIWGGMPGLLHKSTKTAKMELLENIVSTYITKDIKALIKEENVRAFNNMLYSLAQNQGSIVVSANLSREHGVSESTVAYYLEVLSQTYVCHVISSYSNNLANELKKSKKCYLFDVGIRNSLLKDFRNVHNREDKGVINETFILNELISQLKPNTELKFWRTKKGAEVDFILLVNRQPVPIEVKSEINEAQIPSGIKSFFKAYPKTKKAYVFNVAIQKTLEWNGCQVEFCAFENIVNFVDRLL